MSELIDINEVDDRVWTITSDGRLRMFVVQTDGSLVEDQPRLRDG